MLDNKEVLESQGVVPRFSIFLDSLKDTVVVLVEVDPISEESLLEVAAPLLLRQVDKFVENLQGLWLFLGVEHGFDEAVEIPATPVKIEVISFLEEIRDLLEDVDKVLGPPWPHQSSDYLPCLDRGVIDYELVFGFVLSLSSNLDGPLDIGEGLINLIEVFVAFKL